MIVNGRMPAFQLMRVFGQSCLLLLFAVLYFLPSPALSQPPSEEIRPYQVPTDMSGVYFYLITVDVGDMIWDNFGHTALRVYDQNSDTDTVFNWGVFDVSGGIVPFSWNFFKGIMNYRLATSTPSQEFGMYRDQRRSVWQDKLNLTNPQKEILYRRLMWNLEPENVEYAYQYFFDNCTTKVRDYLDEALLGKVRREYAGVTEKTFREQVQSHYESVPLIAFSLDVLMNSNIDRAVTEWEDMYLPLQLRDRLLNVKSDVTQNGEQLMLLNDPQVIMEFPAPSIKTNGYVVSSLLLWTAVILLILSLKRVPRSYFAGYSRVSLRAPGISFRVLGMLGLLTAVFSGVYGAVMLGSWFVSDHIDTHHNFNLLLFWPTDLLGIPIALRWLFFCKPWKMTHNSAPFIHYYLFMHIAGMAIYTAIGLFGLTDQSIYDIAIYVLPGFFLYTLLIWFLGFEPVKPKDVLLL